MKNIVKFKVAICMVSPAPDPSQRHFEFVLLLCFHSFQLSGTAVSRALRHCNWRVSNQCGRKINQNVTIMSDLGVDNIKCVELPSPTDSAKCLHAHAAVRVGI